MKNEIDNLIKATIAIQCSNTLYGVLGKYGDKLPQEVQDGIRKDAEEMSSNFTKIKNKVSKQLYTPSK